MAWALSLLMVALTYANPLQANVLTVNHLGGAMYTDLQQAIDEAASGDTLYISGETSYTYPTVTIDKSNLTLIGKGYNTPNFTNNPRINKINLNGANDLALLGLRINGGSTYEVDQIGTDTLHNIIVSNCYIAGIRLKANGLLIENSLIFGRLNNVVANALIKNSVLKSGYLDSQSSSIVFEHCIFLNYDEINGGFLQFSNCVIDGGNITNDGTFTFTNCLTNDSTPLPAGNGNISLPDGTELFVDVQADFFDSDYHLAAGSPGIGAASDGTNIGMYGGSTPYSAGLISSNIFAFHKLPHFVDFICKGNVPAFNRGYSVQPEKVYGNVFQQRQIFGGKAARNARTIFVLNDVLNVMQSVFNMPMSPNALGHLPGIIGRKTEYEIMAFIIIPPVGSPPETANMRDALDAQPIRIDVRRLFVQLNEAVLQAAPVALAGRMA